ncbi:hypothetical protein V6N12_066835 [Hibiscus sabdariffa]|uniref:Uncharacterized protein n=1 Tax=Hibiscus sabdariffa TaxID=183260 RepID=A0ABR2C9M0_9ROSI
MWSGAASSDWAGGGDNGVLGAEPKGESGVDCLLAGMAGGVEVGLGVEVWLGTRKTCGVAAGGERAAVGADGPAFLGAAVGEWVGLVDGVGIATLMGAAFATSILRMYSFLDQPAFSIVYLSPGWVGSCNFLGDDFPNIKAVARHDDVDQHQPSAIDCLVVGEEIFDGLVILVFKSSLQSINTQLIVGQAEYFIDSGCVGCYSSATNGDFFRSISVVGVEFPYPIEVAFGWLPCKSEPAEFAQSSVDGGLQAVIHKSVIEEEPLFFPSVLGSIFGVSRSSFCVGRLVGHALGE